MTEWKPISLIQLYDQIQKTETDLNGELWNFWQLIKIDPTKWTNKALAEEAGFSSTQRFANAFLAKTGIPATFFIEELKKEEP